MGAAHLAVIAALALAWAGTADADQVPDQTVWLTLAVVALGGAVVADCLWLLAGRGAAGRAKRSILDDIAGVAARAVEHAGGLPETLVASTPMTHYHRAGCALAAGKPVRDVTVAAVRRSGRTPCDVCAPPEIGA